MPLHLACFRNAHCLATVTENYKLIYHYQDRPPQLFDLSLDPNERRNLASEQPERVTQGIDALLAWEAGVDKLHAQSSQRALERYVQRTPHTQMQHTSDVRFGPSRSGIWRPMIRVPTTTAEKTRNTTPAPSMPSSRA